ncbi:TPA: hypothetical protein N0F65_005629 [Lagenidium giganteum]|uniref:Uncharacterized protein n=1 Tax=Lagenidium giganteum TaxID=4803 RepID=A0AAV2YWF5_9STRA|nr:TPA: hypothetical protein N0F65_005629 [Lagenidium giganteum]
MVATPTKLIGFAALAVAAMHNVDASGISALPITSGGKSFELNKNHPAYAGKLASDAHNVVVHDNANAVDPSAVRMRRLEATNEDIQRLEAHFGTKMETNVNTLKQQYGSATFNPAPWPSSYWPTFRDGINFRWSDDKSAAEKYALAYGKDVKQFMDDVSRKSGVLSQSDAKACTSNDQCTDSSCAIREGETSGFCIPGWFGICHAWAPASILEPEPRCPVKKGDVTFQPLDIKALMTQVYDGVDLETVFTGARFNGPDEPKNKDKYGRFEDAARRDLGPGYFHIAISNILGKFKQSFVVDTSSGAEVWNQPVRSYEVVSLQVVDAAELSQAEFGTNKYPFNRDMVKLAKVSTKLSWVFETGDDGEFVANGKVDGFTHTATYDYVLELDANDNIIGGEWLGGSQEQHPDFLWFATGKPAADAQTSFGLSYKDVRQLLDESVACGGSVTTAPTTAPPTAGPTSGPSTAPSTAPSNAPSNGPTGVPGNNGTATPVPVTSRPHNGSNSTNVGKGDYKQSKFGFLPKQSERAQKNPGHPVPASEQQQPSGAPKPAYTPVTATPGAGASTPASNNAKPSPGAPGAGASTPASNNAKPSPGSPGAPGAGASTPASNNAKPSPGAPGAGASTPASNNAKPSSAAPGKKGEERQQQQPQPQQQHANNKGAATPAPSVPSKQAC